MNRIEFLLAKLRDDEAALSALGTPLAEALGTLRGREVALVGNARSLAAGEEGARIDAADVVIRLNAAPLPSARSHGARTDWLAASVGVDRATLGARAPRWTVWMASRRRRLPWHLARRAGFVLNPRARNLELRALLGAPPTTGLMVIDRLAGSALAGARLWGFDFFASASLSGGRAAGDVPHDFAAERAWVEALLARDPRFSLAGRGGS